MLTHLQVTDFTLVKKLSLDLNNGLTALTGETGAGKSILLGALGLVVGERADAGRVRLGAERAEVCASFDVDQLVSVKNWLKSADLGTEECIIRRVVNNDGRSRAYINGQVVTLTQLKALGAQLIDIHSQHEHQSLLKTFTHRSLLDSYGQLDSLSAKVKQAFGSWQRISTELDRVVSSQEELNARYQLLSYQAEELDQLALEVGECESLEAKQKQLENYSLIQQSCQQVQDICVNSDGSVEEQLNKVLQLVKGLPHQSSRVEEVSSMLGNALIQVEEAVGELQRDMESIEGDEFSLIEVEQRLTAVYDIARKHRVSPESLPELHQGLSDELAEMQSGDGQLELLQAQLESALSEYQVLAEKLSSGRVKAAKRLSKAVNQQLATLAMTHAKFEVSFHSQSIPTAYGQESTEFLISTIPGQPPKPIAKIASGGELSRISLSIQVVAAKTSVVPIIVFDEVDVGIGGETGDVVGRLLRTLGESSQVLCVTHLAQVASKAHQHLKVEKQVSKKGAETNIQLLDDCEKVVEVARMMGGGESEQSIAHAREMLEA